MNNKRKNNEDWATNEKSSVGEDGCLLVLPPPATANLRYTYTKKKGKSFEHGLIFSNLINLSKLHIFKI